MLTCSKCKASFAEEYFPRNSKAKNRNGRGYWCRACNSQHYYDNQDRQRRSNRRAAVQRRYGLSLEEYDAALAAGCAICGKKPPVRMVMDHCHSSGVRRDALCNGCNTMLGSAGDRPEVLRAAADYLESHAVT